MTAAVRPGECRYCHCTEENPCRLPPSGDPCAWFNAERTVCSRGQCILRCQAELKASTARAVSRFWRSDKAGRVHGYGRRNRRKKKGGKAA